jgi:hypothetical protein
VNKRRNPYPQIILAVTFLIGGIVIGIFKSDIEMALAFTLFGLLYLGICMAMGAFKKPN